MWLGVLGVAIFAVTLPMTRLATGTAEAPQLSPWFVTLGRAALAGLLSVVFLLATRSPVPQRQHWRPLGIAVLGNAVGYPLLLGYALRVVTASHAAVITALLRNWLAEGTRLLWFNRCMAAILVLTAWWMLSV